MLRRLCAAAACCAVVATPWAVAADWSVFGFISQRFEADSNLQLNSDEDEEAVGSTTQIGADFVASTPRTSFIFSPSLRGTFFTGPGSSSSQNLVAPQASAQISHSGQRVNLSGGLSLSVRPTSFAEINEFQEFEGGPTNLDLVNQDATAISISANGGLGYQLTPRDSLNLGVNASARRFTGNSATLSPSTSVGLSSGFSHSVSETLSTDVGLSLRRVQIDGADETENLILGVDAGVRATANETLSFGFRGGLNAIRTDSETEGVTTGIGFKGSGSLFYDVRNDLSLSLSGSQGLEPGSSGELQTRTSVSAGVQHFINSRERADIGLSLSRQASVSTFAGSTATQLVQASLGYERSLTSSVVGRIGYSARLRLDEPSAATSHKVFLTLSKSFSVIP